MTKRRLGRLAALAGALALAVSMFLAVGLSGTAAFGLTQPSPDDFSEFSLANPNGSIYCRQGTLGSYQDSGKITSGEFAGYWYNNYAYGYSISKEKADGTNPGGFDRDGTPVYFYPGAHASLDQAGALQLSALSFETMWTVYVTYGLNNLGSVYFNDVMTENGQGWQNITAQFQAFAEDVRESDFEMGVPVHRQDLMWIGGMKGIRFHWGDSDTGCLANMDTAAFSFYEIRESFVAFVSNDHISQYRNLEDPSPTGFEFFLVRDKFLETYISLQNQGTPLGEPITNDHYRLTVDGKTYENAQLFTNGYLYIRDNGTVGSVTDETYFEKDGTFGPGVIVENLLVCPSWFTNKSPVMYQDPGDPSVYYFNCGEDMAVGTKGEDGSFTFAYYGRKNWNPETQRLEILRYEKSNFFMSSTFNANTFGAIQSFYEADGMDADMTMEEFTEKCVDAMWAAYERYCGEGFNCGHLRGDGVALWGSSLIVMTFYGSDGIVTSMDGGLDSLYLLYNPVMDKSFAMYGTVLQAHSMGLYDGTTSGGAGIDRLAIGAPTGEIEVVSDGSIYDGSLYQNYTRGYIFIEKGHSVLRKFVSGGEYVPGDIPFDEELTQKGEEQRAAIEEEWLKDPAYRAYLRSLGQDVPEPEQGCGSNLAGTCAAFGCLAACFFAVAVFAKKRGEKR